MACGLNLLTVNLQKVPRSILCKARYVLIPGNVIFIKFTYCENYNYQYI